METDVQLAPGYIETFAGNGKARSTGDGKRAVKAGIPLLRGLRVSEPAPSGGAGFAADLRAGLDFVRRAENLVLIGGTGTGKTGIALGLLRQASHSHHDRARVAQVLRRRGHAVKGDLSKIYRSDA